ncbi:hypothetical protein JHK87_052105 [Glycine soja]|nr:hypothetical protein JHK87_052105 [Glycine soja]
MQPSDGLMKLNPNAFYSHLHTQKILHSNCLRKFLKRDFRQRFAKLLASTFRGMEYELALSIIDPKINFKCQDPTETSSDKCLQSVRGYLSPHDMKRLEAYVDNLADFHRSLANLFLHETSTREVGAMKSTSSNSMEEGYNVEEQRFNVECQRKD